MKKSVIAASVIVILAAGYTAASWYTGNIIENKIDDKINQFSQKINQNDALFDIDIKYRDYQKGIFSTSFHLKVSAVSHDEGNRSLFDDVVTIYHGPFPWSQIKSANFSPKMAAVYYKSTKESDEKLWAAAGNKPFMTVNSTIDYSENINIAASNEPINYIDEQKGISWQTTANTLSISTDKQLNNMDINSKIAQFAYQDQQDDINISVQNLTFSGQLSMQDDSSYKITHNFAVENLILSNISDQNTNNIKVNLAPKSVAQNPQSDSTVSATIDHDHHEDSQPNPKQINVSQLNITSDSIAKDSTLNGSLAVAIEGLTFGQQNLGKGEMMASYDISSKNYSSTNKKESFSIKNSFIKLDKLLWQTAQGNLNANFAINIEGDSFNLNKLDENNVLFAEVKVNLPFKSLSYLLAQINNTDKSLPNDDDINSADQYVLFFSSLFLMKSPLIEIHYDPEDNIENGIYIDLYYSKDERRARLKGEEMTPGQFWHAISKNKLPIF